MIMKIKYILILSIFLASCGVSHQQAAISIDNAYMVGNYKEAAEESSDSDILNSLNSGTSLFLDYQYDKSYDIYNSADKKIEAALSSSGINKTEQFIAATVASESVLDYLPSVGDSLYLSSYKILNSLALKDKSSARIEVNRAYEKQKNASLVFKSEIEKLKKSLDTETLYDFHNTQNIEFKTKKILGDFNKEFEQWNAYQDYLNPLTTYLSGLYFLINAVDSADVENAVTYLKRVVGMSANNSTVKQDLLLAQDFANGKKEKFLIKCGLFLKMEWSQILKRQDLIFHL